MSLVMVFGSDINPKISVISGDIKIYFFISFCRYTNIYIVYNYISDCHFVVGQGGGRNVIAFDRGVSGRLYLFLHPRVHIFLEGT